MTAEQKVYRQEIRRLNLLVVDWVSENWASATDPLRRTDIYIRDGIVKRLDIDATIKVLNNTEWQVIHVTDSYVTFQRFIEVTE